MKKLVSLIVCISFFVVLGCSEESSEQPVSQTSNPASTLDGSKYLLENEPGGAEDVIKVRESSKDGDDVLIVGRIGGSENPWIASRAAFSIVDPSLKSCAECGSDDCPKPWDYC